MLAPVRRVGLRAGRRVGRGQPLRSAPRLGQSAACTSVAGRSLRHGGVSMLAGALMRMARA